MHDKTLDKLNGLVLSSDLETAKTEAIAIVDSWQWKDKQEKTINMINEMTHVEDITKMLWNTALSGVGLKVNKGW